MYKQKIDSVWAEEPGVAAKFRRNSNGQVIVTIIQNGKETQTATLGSWRWEQIIRAMTEEVEPSEPVEVTKG